MPPADYRPGPLLHHRYGRRGFNLIEAAIVLGVIGLVVGGIWVAAAAVSSTKKINDAYQGAVTTMSNMQQLYKGLPATSGGTLVTQAMCRAGAIPDGIFNLGNCSSITSVTHNLKNPSNASSPRILLYTQGCCGQPYDFAFVFTNISTEACTQLVMKLGINGTGMAQIGIWNNSSYAYVYDITATPADTSVDLTEATTACSSSYKELWIFFTR